MATELTEYLKAVVSLEKSIYTQTQAIDQLEEEITTLGQWSGYTKPQPPAYYSNEFHFDDFGTATGGLAAIGALIGLFSGAFLICTVIGAFVGFILYLIIYTSSENSENNRRRQEYDNALQAYNSAMEKDEQRVLHELAEKERLCDIVASMKAQREETQQLLDQYYATNIIWPKYRNLIAVCSLCEYFLSGATDTMKEAYNKYDNEVLLKAIVTKLDVVIQQLDCIKDNQFTLYTAIQEGNRISQSLVLESRRQASLIEQSIDYQAIQSAQSAQLIEEAHFHNQLAIYDIWSRNR